MFPVIYYSEYYVENTLKCCWVTDTESDTCVKMTI